jgi:hypothetical protein
VRRYLNFSKEEDFFVWISRRSRRIKKLSSYYDFICKSLEEHPYLSCSQIEDRLREHYDNLPDVHSKTIYNFVMSIRSEKGLVKNNSSKERQCLKLEDVPYGFQAQEDWGEYNMYTAEGKRRKVYFFALILSRSRYKYVEFSDVPYTSSRTVEAHNKAFIYLSGQAREIVYDQDRVLLTDENKGDYLLTKEFAKYCQEMQFKPVFCRKSDPQSKGKIENVIGFVKKNFLRGRKYENLESLNSSCLKWLERTGNGKKHATTGLVPSLEWLIEKETLIALPASLSMIQPVKEKMLYRVRKDNTISYKGSYYSLPLGTYKKAGSQVQLEEKEGMIYLYDTDNHLLANHKKSALPCQYVYNTDHRRDKTRQLVNLKEDILSKSKESELMHPFIESIHRDKPRYIRDHLLLIRKIQDTGLNAFMQPGLEKCIENDLYNANNLQEILKYIESEKAKEMTACRQITAIKTSGNLIDRLTPEKREISTYQSIM